MTRFILIFNEVQLTLHIKADFRSPQTCSAHDMRNIDENEKTSNISVVGISISATRHLLDDHLCSRV